MSARLVVVTLAAIAGCGTLAPEGGGAQNLPVSGSGPYTKLAAPSPLLADPGASLDDAQLLVDGEALQLFYTRRDDAGHAAIGHARFSSITDDAPEITIALAADSAWESGAVSQPAVITLAGGRALLAYVTGAGAIGIALSDSDAGDGWTKAAAPALVPGSDEGSALASPALLALDDRRVRLIYLAAGVLRAADASVEDLLARAATPFARSVAAALRPGDAPWLEEIGRVTARTVITDRRRFDLFVTGRAAGLRVVGFAGSFDGARFLAGAAPLLEARTPEEWAPSAAAWRGGSLLVFTGLSGRRTALFAASEE